MLAFACWCLMHSPLQPLPLHTHTFIVPRAARICQASYMSINPPHYHSLLPLLPFAWLTVHIPGPLHVAEAWEQAILRLAHWRKPLTWFILKRGELERGSSLANITGGCLVCVHFKEMFCPSLSPMPLGKRLITAWHQQYSSQIECIHKQWNYLQYGSAAILTKPLLFILGWLLFTA